MILVRTKKTDVEKAIFNLVSLDFGVTLDLRETNKFSATK